MTMATRTEPHHSVLLATPAMGTRFEIVIRSEDAVCARAAGEAALAEIERLHRQLSFYASDSLLAHINRHATRAPVRIDLDTCELLRDAIDVWHASEGAFDITRGSGMDAIVLDEQRRTVRITRGNVALDLGGIAKGHAVDRAAAILRDSGITRALVHGGTSSIAAIGAPAEHGDGWRIAIGGSTRTVALRDATLSVSSGAKREHIVNPATGAYVSGPHSAVVVGPSARLGDAWSTALAVRGSRPAGLHASWQTFFE